MAVKRLLIIAALALGASGCTGDIGVGEDPDASIAGRRDAGSGEQDAGPAPPDTPNWVPLRRLTNAELREHVLASLRTEHDGTDAAMRRNFNLPNTEPGDVFRNHTPELTVGAGAFAVLLEATEKMARSFAATSRAQPDVLTQCEGFSESDCLDRFIEERGQRLYRRPLMEREKASLRRVYDEASAELDAEGGYEALIVAMVMSPQTLYLLEGDDPELYSWHVASRLAFYLWRRSPDDALLAAAADGSLNDEAVFAAQIARMMDDDRFYDAQGEFFLELLDLSRFDAYYKDRSLDGTLEREGMRADFVANVRRVYESDGTFADLLSGELEFTDPLMNAYFPEGTYPGILAHPVFNWTHSAQRKNSPIERGVTVLERLIRCDHLPPPPMNVEPISAPNESNSLRERLAVHRENPACASCHDSIDPIGLTFEAYDWTGAHHRFDFWNDNGTIVESETPVDTSGALVDTDNDGDVSGLGELGQRMAASEVVQDCFVDQSMRYASLRLLMDSDAPQRRAFAVAFREGGLRLRSLVREIALSSLIRFEPESRP